MPRFGGEGIPATPNIHRGYKRSSYDFASGVTNHLYTPMAITNATGAVVERYSYTAYGERSIVGAASKVSAVGNSRGFTGYSAQEESDLYFARTRSYSAPLGRFTARMPWYGMPGLRFAPISLSLLPSEDAEYLLEGLNEALGPYWQDRYSLYDAFLNSPSNFVEPYSRGVRPPPRGPGGPPNRPNPPQQRPPVEPPPPQAPPGVPSGWQSRPADNGNGTVWFNPSNPCETIRIMGPTSRYPNGYWRQTNGNNQPIDPRTGRPGSNPETHVPLPDPNQRPPGAPPAPRPEP
jgi:hypothetical protein